VTNRIRIAWTGVWYAVHRGRRLCGVVWKRKHGGEWVAIDRDRVGMQTSSFLRATRYLVGSDATRAAAIAVELRARKGGRA